MLYSTSTGIVPVSPPILDKLRDIKFVKLVLERILRILLYNLGP